MKKTGYTSKNNNINILPKQSETMKKLLFTLVLTGLTTFCMTAQTNFNLPENIELKSQSDYAKYEDDIIEAAKWLEATDLNVDTDKRKKVNAFIIQWLSGTSKITIEIDEPLMELCGENNQLLVLYMASYSSHFLQNPSATKTAATKAGIISMINVYKKDIAIEKSKEMQKAVKAFDQNKLDGYIEKNFK